MRPEWLVNPYALPIRDGVMWNKEVIDAWEAGADAYEEGLKRQGIKQLLQDPVLHYEHWHGKWGTICWIEEE